VLFFINFDYMLLFINIVLLYLMCCNYGYFWPRVPAGNGYGKNLYPSAGMDTDDKYDLR
jgi:hypothetical protein